MTDRIALIVHRDTEVRRVVSEALSIFKPGFHVTTARDLETATDWMAVLEPDLVILGSDADEPEVIIEWLITNRVDLANTVVTGDGAAAEQLGGTARVQDPLQLSELMSTVRQLAARSDGSVSDTSIGQG